MQNFVRTVTRDVERDGETLYDGDKVMLLFGAANRDPDRFPDPERFVLDRDARKHLAFGWGIHRCVGAFLAELELRIIAEELLRYELTLAAEPEFKPSLFGAFLAIEELMVNLRLRGPRDSGTRSTTQFS